MSSAGGELREGFGDPQSLVTMNFEAASTSLISLLRVLCCCFLVGLVCFFFSCLWFSQMEKNDKAQVWVLGGLRGCRTSLYGEGSKFLQVKLRMVMLLQV